MELLGMRLNDLHFFRNFVRLLLQILTGRLVLTVGQMMGLLEQESSPLWAGSTGEWPSTAPVVLNCLDTR